MSLPVEVIAPTRAAEEPGARRLSSVPEIAEARIALAGRTVWHVNSTATGGGVAELLRSALEWHSLIGIPAKWLVPAGEARFFEITKQIHHNLHGSPGPGMSLGEEQQELYESVTRMQAEAALAHMRSGDVVVLHDPQPLGMAEPLADAGMRVIWRTHIGTTDWTENVEAAWKFLAPFLDAPSRYVFSSESYIPKFLDRERSTVVFPTINPESTKCRSMDDREVHRVLELVGLEATDKARSPELASETARPLRNQARIFQDRSLPPDASTVIQISRWDPLKDMGGVLEAFAQHIAPDSSAHLVLTGPDPDDIPDDPENAQVMDQVMRQYNRLSSGVRQRVHMVVLSLRDLETNALIVNALQRRATVIAQKSLQEGFGLAVTEAMWKFRPVVGSAVGGIREQITDGTHGLLVENPSDLVAFGQAVNTLLSDSSMRGRLVSAAHEHCRRNFLIDREMADYARLYTEV